MADLHQIVYTRSAFFANRVDAYARAKGLDNQAVVANLQELAFIHGERAITHIIDEVVPPELHSTKMPAMVTDY